VRQEPNSITLSDLSLRLAAAWRSLGDNLTADENSDANGDRGAQGEEREDDRGTQVTHKLGYRSPLSNRARAQRRICSVSELRPLHLASHSRNDPHKELGFE
jgi:hypothetical protein